MVQIVIAKFKPLKNMFRMTFMGYETEKLSEWKKPS